MGMVDKQWEFLKDISMLIRKAEDMGIVLTAGEAYRTAYQQEHYVKTGRSKTMHSRHLNRLAMDFNFFIDGKLTYDSNHPLINELGNYWESLGDTNKWGGNWTSFKDTPHFQK